MNEPIKGSQRVLVSRLWIIFENKMRVRIKAIPAREEKGEEKIQEL